MHGEASASTCLLTRFYHPGHPDHWRNTKKFIFDRNKNLVVTRPGTQPATSLTTGFFLMAWLANVTTRFFFAWTMPNATTGFFDSCRHMFFGSNLLVCSQHSSLRNYSGVQLMMLGLFGCVTTGFFFTRASWALSPQDFFPTEPAWPCHHKIFSRPDPDGTCHHKIFISHFKIKILW